MMKFSFFVKYNKKYKYYASEKLTLDYQPIVHQEKEIVPGRRCHLLQEHLMETTSKSKSINKGSLNYRSSCLHDKRISI